MGIDDAIARANEAEAEALGQQHDQSVFDAKAKRIVDDLYKDFVQRLRRAGVKPQSVFASRYRRTLLGTKEVYFDTGQKAWVVYSPEISEQLSANPWVAVTPDGLRIMGHVETRKGSTIFRQFPPESVKPLKPYRLRQAQPWEDAEMVYQAELKRVSDDLSEILAQALGRLGAI